MPQTKSHLTHQDFIRKVATRPLSMRQPYYESLRLSEAADYIDELEAENSAIKKLVHLVAEFMLAQSNQDLDAMNRLIPELQPLLDTMLAENAKADRTVAVSGEIVTARTPDGDVVGHMESDLTPHVASDFNQVVDEDEGEKHE